jgi:DNA primase
MFPIRSVKGELIGFGGRVLDSGEPKYLNSPETPVFVKGRELYGLYEARTALRTKGYALVVEGYMDVVALAQAGFGNAVATLGTACTAEHVHKLPSQMRQLSLTEMPPDRRRRALEAALPHADLRSAFPVPAPEHDPDSFVRELGRRPETGWQCCCRGSSSTMPARRDLAAPKAVRAGASPAAVAGCPKAPASPALPELARHARGAPTAALWVTPPRRRGLRLGIASAHGRPTPRPAGLPTGLRLLLRHNEWWEQLSGDDHAAV